MKRPFDLIERLQVRTAMCAIGRSTLRSQGASGMVDYARKFLCKVDLNTLSAATAEQFAITLDTQTDLLAAGFPGSGKGNWGAARKSLNIFLRDALYCRPLSNHFNLVGLEPWLEVPLDSNVHKGLVEDAEDSSTVPKWRGVKALTPKCNADLQSIASVIASSLGVARVHLDIRYWRKDAIDAFAGCPFHQAALS